MAPKKIASNKKKYEDNPYTEVFIFVNMFLYMYILCYLTYSKNTHTVYVYIEYLSTPNSIINIDDATLPFIENDNKWNFIQ